jgi:ABC-type glycerol-3-phosphate transport system permease component
MIIPKIKISRIFLYLVLIVIAILVIVPLFSTLMISFKTMPEIAMNYWSPPSGFYLGNYFYVLTQMARPLLNSFIITIPAVSGSVFLGTFAAFYLSRTRFRFKNWYYYLFVAGSIIPSFTILAPIFNIWSYLGLINSYQGIIFIEIISSLPFAVIIQKSFFERIPSELIDAARIEGCSELDLYLKICLPLAVPAMISAFVIEFTYVWNDFVWPLILVSKEEYQPMTVEILRMTTQYAAQVNYRAAAAILTAIVPLILFVVLQKYFVRGILGGSVVKG